MSQSFNEPTDKYQGIMDIAEKANPIPKPVTREDIIEQCARGADMHDRAGFEWVKGSLYDSIVTRIAHRIRQLK